MTSFFALWDCLCPIRPGFEKKALPHSEHTCSSGSLAEETAVLILLEAVSSGLLRGGDTPGPLRVDLGAPFSLLLLSVLS